VGQPKSGQAESLPDDGCGTRKQPGFSQAHHRVFGAGARQRSCGNGELSGRFPAAEDQPFGPPRRNHVPMQITVENIEDALDSDSVSDNSQIIEAIEDLKMNE